MAKEEWRGPAVTRKRNPYDKRKPGGDNLCYPVKGYEIHPSDRFVFFSSLLTAADDSPLASEEFVNGATELVSNATTILSKIESQLTATSDADADEKTLTIVEQSIDFLNRAIAYEQQNEINYFSQELMRLQGAKGFSKETVNDLQKVINTFRSLQQNPAQAIDYISFIDVVNKIKHEITDTSKIYQREIDRLQDLERQYQEKLDELIPQYKKGTKPGRKKGKMPRDAEGKVIKNDGSARRAYRQKYAQSYNARRATTSALLNQYYDAYELYLDKMIKDFGIQAGPTLETQISDYMNKLIADINTDPDLIGKICEYLESNGIASVVSTGNYHQYSAEVTSFLINLLSQQIDETWWKSDQYFKIKSTVIQLLNDSFDGAAESAYKQMKSIVGGKKVSRVKLNRTVTNYSDMSGRGLADFFMKFIADYGHGNDLFKQEIGQFLDENASGKGSIQSMIDEATRLNQLLGSGHNFKTTRFSQKNNQYQEDNESGKLLSTLKGELSKKLHKSIADKAERIFKQRGTPADFSASMKEALKLLKLSISGPAIQEYLNLVSVTGSGKRGVKINIGSANKKTDSLIITTDTGRSTDAAVKQALSQTLPLWENIANTFYEQYKTNASATYDKWEYHDSKSLFIDENGVLNEEALAEFERSMPGTGELKAFDAFKTRLTAAIAELKRGAKDNEDLQQKLQDLGNNFYVSSTDKTYNYYQDQLGFMGGSLGTDISTQLININRLYEIGGLTPIDINLLIFAAMNSANGATLGSLELKHSIENYCSTVAAFMMFDEGSIEIAAIQGRAEELLETSVTPKFLHLYHVNGSYFPGSYILTLIRDGIASMEKIYRTGSKSFKAKNGTILNSTLRPDDYQYGYQETTKSAEWKNVSITASNRIELKFVFLAGLLDMMNQLQDAAKQIESF